MTLQHLESVLVLRKTTNRISFRALSQREKCKKCLIRIINTRPGDPAPDKSKTRNLGGFGPSASSVVLHPASVPFLLAPAVLLVALWQAGRLSIPLVALRPWRRVANA